MGFKLGAFVEGFATQAAEQIQADKKNARDTFKIAYSNWLDKSEEETKTRRTQQKELEEVGSMLKTLNMSDAQALKVLEGGPTLAKTIATQLLEVQMTDPNFSPDDFVKATDDSGLTLSDGIKKMMGTLDTSGLAPYKAPVEGNFLFDPQKAIDRERAQLEGAFGMTTDELRAQARGEYTTEELGIEGEVDYSALGITDPMDALRREQLELQIAKLKEEDDEDKKLTDGNIRGYINGLNARFSSELGVEITSSTDENGKTTFQTTGGTAAQRKEALEVAYKATEKLEDYIKSDEYDTRTKAVNAAVEYGISILNKDLITPAGSTTQTGTVKQPSTTTSQTGSGAVTTTQSQVQSNYNPSSGQTPAQFAQAEAKRLGFSGATPARKAQIKSIIQAQLTAKNVAVNTALSAVKGLK